MLKLGVIIRDHANEVMGTLRASKHYNNSPFTIEALVFIVAIQFPFHNRWSTYCGKEMMTKVNGDF